MTAAPVPAGLGPVDQLRLATAVGLAARWHGDQVRKGTTIPYVSHLLQVAGLVLEHGGAPDLAVAALLHDAVEDTEATIDDVDAAFGPGVAAVVADCTDTLPDDRPGARSPWRVRKDAWLEAARTMPDGSLLVAACDKRHNLGTLVADARAGGPAAISPPRFSSTPAQQVWFHRTFLEAAAGRLPGRLAAELHALVADLAAAAGVDDDAVAAVAAAGDRARPRP